MATAGNKLKFRDILRPGSSKPFDLDSMWPFSVTSTEPQGWRLITEDAGRLMWRYLPKDQEREDIPQDSPAKYFLGLPTVCIISQIACVF